MTFDRFQFKLILIFLMVLDHIHYFVSDELNLVFHIVSRCVAVGFAYLAVESLYYTRDVKKYLLKLYGFAIFMLIGNKILNNLYAPYVYITNSIIMTLALGISFILAYKNISNFLLKKIVMLAIFYISQYFEGGIIILSFMFLTYLFKNNKRSRNISYIIMSAILFLSTLKYALTTENILYTMLKYPLYLFIIIIPILKMYNGKLGLKNKFSNYFFYIFYPIHIWIIGSIEYYMKTHI